ncbi:hypothetical protein FOL46_007800 [Perkinsus olseni]|uniref:LITAF domain-containing protein n=1 Tax=Perkinsus olseni TaxID=32597 RepID=A0A7J6MNK9_PEROL|nr:hypothetical protein FOL46_007800 [Perkinsus olseni]
MQPGVAYPAPMAQPFFEHEPVIVTCPNCGTVGQTRVWHRIGLGSVVAMLLIAALFFPLFWLPLFCRSCQSAQHHCLTCNYKVGEKSFLFDEAYRGYYAPPHYYATAQPSAPRVPPHAADPSVVLGGPIHVAKG